MQITNKLNLPYGLVKAVSPDPHNKPGEISATTLIQGTKQVILTQRHWNELEDDVADRIWAVFGTAVHALLVKEKMSSVKLNLNRKFPTSQLLAAWIITTWQLELSLIIKILPCLR